MFFIIQLCKWYPVSGIVLIRYINIDKIHSLNFNPFTFNPFTFDPVTHTTN